MPVRGRTIVGTGLGFQVAETGNKEEAL